MQHKIKISLLLSLPVFQKSKKENLPKSQNKSFVLIKSLEVLSLSYVFNRLNLKIIAVNKDSAL